MLVKQSEVGGRTLKSSFPPGPFLPAKGGETLAPSGSDCPQVARWAQAPGSVTEQSFQRNQPSQTGRREG